MDVLALHRAVGSNNRLGKNLTAESTRLLAGERHSGRHFIATEGGGRRLHGGEIQHPHEVLGHSGLGHSLILTRRGKVEDDLSKKICEREAKHDR